MNALAEIQHWYLSQCDGVWEHGEAITIETLDNPGWRVKIALRGKKLETKAFQEVSRLQPGSTWIHCLIKDGKFVGAGGPQQLEEILLTFLNWAEAV